MGTLQSAQLLQAAQSGAPQHTQACPAYNSQPYIQALHHGGAMPNTRPKASHE